MKICTTTIVLTFVLLAALFGVYVAGYCFLGSEWRPRGPGTALRMRVFASAWQANLYAPAGWVESRIRGQIVQIGTQEDLRMQSP